MYTDVRGSAFSVGIVEFVISPQPSVDSGRGSAGGSAYGMGTWGCVQPRKPNQSESLEVLPAEGLQGTQKMQNWPPRYRPGELKIPDTKWVYARLL